MRHHFLAMTAIALLAIAAPGAAQNSEEGDELVRLPGQGTVKPEARSGKDSPARMVPGGGLIMSFDANADGRVTPAELEQGAALAFTLADANAEGSLSALEQQDWANNLPTRDDTLANPVRFDPNLDRVVSQAEFVAVIAQLAAAYAEEGSGDILLSKLTAPEPDKDDRRLWSGLNRSDDYERR